ncbi:MAG: hypothetical protein LBK71_08485 [Verrucomicrobiales bacterium]|jgi:YkoY family integral membrane protein|nr:hypothetical protein [Verrucomicrobiales bacterium]
MTLIDSFNALAWSSIPIILTLAGLEIVLSADNAVVLAVLAKQLRPALQRRALFYGIVGALVLRFLAILGAVWIIKFWFLQIIGGGYLIWLAIDHLTGAARDPAASRFATGSGASFWKVVVLIELTDLAFAVDSVLAAVGVSGNLLIIYSGAIIGLVAMRFAAVAVMQLLEVFPQLKIYAYALVAWIGVKLTLQGAHLGLLQSRALDWETSVHLSMPEFWLVTALIVTAAAVHWLRLRRARR